MQDRALNRKTNLVKIKDPCTGNVLVTIRDPKHKIEPYKNMDGVVDIQDHIDNRKLPTFYKGEPAVTYVERGTYKWEDVFLDLIAPRKR